MKLVHTRLIRFSETLNKEQPILHLKVGQRQTSDIRCKLIEALKLHN